MNVQLNRIDYLQVGLTSVNTLKVINIASIDNQLTELAVIGDHTGSIHCFSIKTDSSNVNTIFKTLPAPNAKINSVQIIKSTTSSSPKILVSFGSSIIRGYTYKGKQFFALELNNSTEPIKHLQVRWPNDIFICGKFIYNHYSLSPQANDQHTVIRSKNFYVSPGKITGLILVDNCFNNCSVSIIACEDRLIRILNQSICEYEIETCGIANSLYCLQESNNQKSETMFIYGTLEGKVALISLQLNNNQLTAHHKWEIPEKGSRPQVNCMTMMEKTGELFIGRSNGSIEVWIFSETLEADGNQSIDFDSSPIFRTHFNCGESVTSICVCRGGTLLLCSTFTGFIFALTRNDTPKVILSTGNEDDAATGRAMAGVMSRENEMKIDNLKSEINTLEKRLIREKENYQEMISSFSNQKTYDKSNLSALPYFAVDDSMILHDDASYLLSFETEVAIDSVIIQCDITLDLVDCERNSAVVSFNDDCRDALLATFRCQSNTTRLTIKIRPIEGQHGILRVYIISRMMPKSCQVKQYTIKALSLHKRSYSNMEDKNDADINKLHIYGSFSLNEAISWLQLCLPEIPEKINLTTSIKYHFISTLVNTWLIVECSKGSLIFQSDNISTISILKDFITREATKKSTAIEMNVKCNSETLTNVVDKIYPKLKTLLKARRRDKLMAAINELKINEPTIINSLMDELDDIDCDLQELPSLERLEGLLTDLYIDFLKVDGSSSKITINTIRDKLDQLTTLIETYADEPYEDGKVLAEKLSEFWDLQAINKWKGK